MVRDKINRILIKSISMASILTMITPSIITANRFTQSVTSRDPDTSTTTEKTIIVLDPGHGKSSSTMSNDQKTSEEFVQNSSGAWGEWRHWKNGTYGDDCKGEGCTGTHPSNGSCWYGIGSGDRETEPTLNLNNANAAKQYLEDMGYEVRMTRTSNEQNPSFTKRASYCFPSNDTSQAPDAELYVCIHSNASNGSARGTAYIQASGSYEQSYISNDYVDRSNKAGDIINTKVAEATGLQKRSPIDQNYLIAFNKNPVPTAYLEIGFYDNSEDLAILQSKSDEIGKAIAEGIHEYLETQGKASKTADTSNSSSNATASRGKITISSNEEKFLGLWKNSVGHYVPYYQDSEKAKYNPDGELVKYANYGYASASIFQSEYWLFDLLSKTERTQNHLQLMKYLMYKYSGNDYGVKEFDFSIFDIENFSNAGGISGDIPLYKATVSKEDFLAAMQEFSDSGAEGHKVKFDKYFLSRAEDIYDWGEKYGINPELIVVFAYAEQGFSDPVGDESNFWGLATPNGADSPSYGNFENGMKAMAEKFKQYNEGAGNWYEEAIEQRAAERQGYDTDGYGQPGTLRGLLSLYTDLLPNEDPHCEGDTGGYGGRAYLREIYEQEYDSKCGSVHSTGDAWTIEEETDASAYVYRQRRKMWETIFGKYAMIGGGSIVEVADMIHQYMEQNNYTYCVYGGNSYEECGEHGKSHGLDSAFETSKTNHQNTCCATFVSWVLQEAGYITEEEHNSNGLNGANNMKDFLISKGWTQITNSAELQPGDVLWYNNHVEIYAGDGMIYNAGSGNAIRNASPSKLSRSNPLGLRAPN